MEPVAVMEPIGAGSRLVQGADWCREPCGEPCTDPYTTLRILLYSTLLGTPLLSCTPLLLRVSSVLMSAVLKEAPGLKGPSLSSMMESK